MERPADESRIRHDLDPEPDMTNDHVTASFSAPPPPTPMPDQLPRARNPKRRQKIVLSVFLVLVVGLFGAIWLATRHSPSSAKAGDCVRSTGEDSVATVACNDPSAAYKVVGRVEDQTQTQATLSSCDAFQNRGVEQVFWSGEQGGTGYVLCLAPLH
jgi:hypothetical protein